MSWRFEVIDRTGAAIGELTGASARKVRPRPINQVPLLQFTVRRDNALFNYFRMVDKTLVKGYYPDATGVLKLKYLGPVSGYQKVTDADAGGSMAVSCAGVGWRLSRRLIEASKSKSGVTYGAIGPPTVTQRRDLIVQTFINEMNGASIAEAARSGDTGIRIGALDSRISATVAGPWYFKNGLEALVELSTALDGFDWRIDPVEPTADATGLQLGTFTAAAYFGQVRPDVVFEYGDGKRNVKNFTEVGDASGMMNRGYILPPGFPDNATEDFTAQYDAPQIIDRGVIYEDVISADLPLKDMRDQLLAAHIKIRKIPKTVIAFTPVRGAEPGVLPVWDTDYTEGDIVQFRAVEEGVETINGYFRIYFIDFDLDDEGNEVPTVTLVSEDSSSGSTTF